MRELSDTVVREVELKAGGVRLRASVGLPSVPAGWVIFAHEGGASLHGSALGSTARKLNEAGLATLSIELLTPAESARSAGLPSEALAERMLAGAEWLRGEGNGMLGVVGAGEGASAALWAASEKGSGIASVVACAPRLEVAAERLDQVEAQTLLIVGGADRRALKRARWARRRLANSEMVVVPGASRLFDAPAALRALSERSVDWFQKTLVGTDQPEEIVRDRLGRAARRRLAAAASLFLMSGWALAPKVYPEVTAAFSGASGLLDIAMSADGDQMTVAGSAGGNVTITSNAGNVDIGAVLAASVLSIRISDLLGGTANPSTSAPAGNQLADVSGVAAANGFTGSPPVIAGLGKGNDTFYGSDFADEVWMHNDDDVLYGNGGDDTLMGQGGNDYVDGGAGNDQLISGGNVDTLIGGAGDDQLQAQMPRSECRADGGEGTDELQLLPTGGKGFLISLMNATGDVAVQGGPNSVSVILNTNCERFRFEGTDTLDTLVGAADTAGIYLDGAGGNDILTGGSGNDTLINGRGVDTSDGGGGIDLFVVGDNNKRQQDTTSDAMGVGQVISLIAANGPVYLKQLENTVDATLSVANMERYQFIGCPGRDTLDGSADTAGITIDGYNGDDSILGGLGNDSLGGGNDNDWLQANAGNDNLDGGNDNDMLLGGAGNDTVTGNNGYDTILGGADNDVLNGSNSDDSLAGEAGNDSLNGGTGNDTLQGNEGNDTLDPAAGNGSLDGGADSDLLIRTFGADNNLIGAAVTLTDATLTLVRDTLIEGNSAANFEQANLTGGGQRYTYPANSVDDLIDASGFSGKLQLSGGLGGNDTLIGGPSDDTFNTNFGLDALTPGGGNDLLNWDIHFDSDTASGAQYSNVPANVAVTLAGGGSDAMGFVFGPDTVSVGLAGFEDVHLTSADGPDVLDLSNVTIGSPVANGQNGNDTIRGSQVGDQLNGGGVNDVIEGNAGNDTFNGGTGDDILTDSAGNDEYDGFGGLDAIHDAAGADTLSLASVSSAVQVNVGSLVVTNLVPNGINRITAEGIDGVIATTLGDLFAVHLGGSTLATSMQLDGGAGVDTLDYDPTGLTGVDSTGNQSAGTIRADGKPDIRYVNMDVVEIGAPASGARVWQVFE
ncbi:MAG: hypothetical protein NTW86_09260 [Candidatus Sumerlaeota bacterium]|nr:hypothetical protein [Candidatus Sumerlaeota bacterium]